MTTAKRVEKLVIKKGHKYYNMLDNFCFMSKNLYNQANFYIRQEFIKNKKWIRHEELDKILKKIEDYPDYRNMPTAQSAQQTLKLLDKNWKSFFKAIKEYGKHPEKFSGRPKLPKYKKKNGREVLTLTNQEVKLKSDGVLYFPKVFQGFIISPKFTTREDFLAFKMVRMLPRRNKIIIEMVFDIEIEENFEKSNRVIGIDLGVNNLATVANNFGGQAFIINGKPLKSINYYYNKNKAYYQGILKQNQDSWWSNRLQRLTDKRNNKINDYIHKATAKIIQFCITNNVSTIIIGYNKGWKKEAKLGEGKEKTKNNQNFCSIPHLKFVENLEYKAEQFGIKTIRHSESYTSGTSFLDDEEPIKKNYDKSRRVSRGMFVSNKGVQINADLNAAYQIIKKVIPIKWDKGCMFHPIVVEV